MKPIILVLALCTMAPGAALYFAVSPDSHLVVVNSAHDTLWRSSDRWPRTDSTLRQFGDTTIGIIWRSKTGVVTGAGSAAFGVSCTTGAALGATVSGGIANVANADSASVGGGGSNRATGLGATIGGGISNTASTTGSTVAGGSNNSAIKYVCNTVGGGSGNTASGYDHATVAGGLNNTASGAYATVAGGYQNSATGSGAIVVGGYGNTASGDYSSITAGSYNLATNAFSIISGGKGTLDSAYGGAALGCSLRVKAADSGAVVIGSGHGAGRLVSDGKWTTTIGGATHNTTFYDDDSANVWGKLIAKQAVTFAGSQLMRVDSAGFAAADTSEIYFYFAGKKFKAVVVP